MKIYLLLIDRERFFFYSGESDASANEDEAANSIKSRRPGWKGWLRARWVKFKAAWDRAESGGMRWMRRAWDWLHTWAHPDETMLARLRTAKKIELYYPSARSELTVRSAWHTYLGRQWWHHLVWLCVNGLIAPIALLTLWLLPGPNLIGYWFLYRTVHHFLIVWSIRRVRQGLIPTEYYPMPALDLPVTRTDDGTAAHAAIDDDGARLEEHMAWHGSPCAKRAPAASQHSNKVTPPVNQGDTLRDE